MALLADVWPGLGKVDSCKSSPANDKPDLGNFWIHRNDKAADGCAPGSTQTAPEAPRVSP